MLALCAAGRAGRAVERDVGEEDGGEFGDLVVGVGQRGFCEVRRFDLVVREAGVRPEALLDAELALDHLSLLLLGAVEKVDGWPPQLLQLLRRRHAQCAERDAVNRDKRVVPDHVDSVAVAKVGVEPVAHANLHSLCKAQVVIARQAAYELPPSLPWARLQSAVPPVVEEDAPKATVLVHPVAVSILLVLLLGRLGRARRPLAAAVKQVAEEKHRVGVELRLDARVGAPHVLVRVLHRERVEGPWPAGIRVRVDELRVGDEDESVGVGTFFLI